ncbi:hypothetical protein JET72_13315 [Pseudomonas juntendi]|uniref:hypothetical protein n=1 Tax=Pseudomonas juntendi TaxID=2666183 RepID=UPI0018E69948|nr:hypothetical protein [Pseudomonas juntendi]MBI6914874.1 hypothetical protein [Pseudomonas juntendi]
MKISGLALIALLSSGAFDVALAGECQNIRQQRENVTRKAGVYEIQKDFITKDYQSCLCRSENYKEFKEEVEAITGSPNAANILGTSIDIIGAHCEIMVASAEGCENIDAIAGLGRLEHYQREDCRWTLKRLDISRGYEDIVYTNDFTDSMQNERYKRLQAADDEHAQKRLELDKSNPEYKWECKKYQDMFAKEGITFTEEHRARYKCY